MVQGVIGRINDKQWQNKTFYSIALNGQDGWYNTGMKKPPAVGTSVRFNEKTNNKGYKEVDGSIEVLADGAAGPAQSVANTVGAQASKSGGGSQASAGSSSSAYWDRKEARDIANDSARELGASRNTAISIIDLAIKNEIIKLPTIAKREEFLWTLLDRYTDKLMGKDGKSTGDNADVGETDRSVATTNDPQSDEWS